MSYQMSYLSYNEDYLRSDGSFLGDSHGEMPNGVNPYDIEDNGPCGRVFPRRSDQTLALHYLREQMEILFNREEERTIQEETYMKEISFTKEHRALTGVHMIRRILGHPGYLPTGVLEEIYAAMSAQYSCMINARRKLKREGINIQEFFNYLQLLEECMRLCMIAIESDAVYDMYFTNQNMAARSRDDCEHANPRNDSDDEL
jgi:hypothetical protein